MTAVGGRSWKSVTPTTCAKPAEQRTHTGQKLKTCRFSRCRMKLKDSKFCKGESNYSNHKSIKEPGSVVFIRPSFVFSSQPFPISHSQAGSHKVHLLHLCKPDLIQRISSTVTCLPCFRNTLLWFRNESNSALLLSRLCPNCKPPLC